MDLPVDDAREAGSERTSGETGVEAPSTRCAAIKPRLRGWLHPGTFPVASSPGIVLVVLRPTARRDARDRRSTRRPPRCCSASARSTTAATGRPRAGRPQAAGPLEHLPDHRRHLHAVQRHPAAATTAAATLLWIVWGGGARRHRVPGASGSGRRAGSTRRSTSRSAGSRSSTSPRLLHTGGAAVVTLLAIGGGLYSARRGRLRHQEAEPVTALVRLPRGLPRADARGVRRALHRHLARDLPSVGCTRRWLSRSRRRPGRWPGPARPAPSPGAARPASPRRARRPAARTRPAPRDRDRATPAATRVSSTWRSGWRSRVITGTARWVNSARARRRTSRPRRPCGRTGARPRGRSRSAARGCPRGSAWIRPSAGRGPLGVRGVRRRPSGSARVPTTVISSRSTVTSTGPVNQSCGRRPVNQPRTVPAMSAAVSSVLS